jgi:hypothetical protein
MLLVGKDLACPSAYAAANKDKARNADSRSCNEAGKAKHDAEGENDRPRCAGRHLEGVARAPLFILNSHHDSPSDEVHDCKHDDPHTIYEVPIKSDNAESLTLTRVNPAEQGEDKGREEKKKAGDYVGRVEPDQRVERGSKEIRADGQAVLIDQLPPFKRRVR